MRQRRATRLNLIARGTSVIALLNFIVYLVVAAAMGGDAWSGKVVSGHYFLSNHGLLTEVTACMWSYSWWHTVSTVFVSHPVGIAAAALWGVRNPAA